ncbi:redoxin domain-containing protein [Herpetosiphon llansteffanensis]|uniref:redoxin domain-containing protein n=1 Tax=Herpetosiphon llansteffanensis TaxID=2094568 RepID=UPI000D7C4F2F|nr:redoxin domain-containing protein [Herpetosiphon llansteffanensis]
MTAIATNSIVDLWILNEAGERVEFETLWHEKPVLVFFMRNIGCGICRQTLLKLRDHAEAFEKAGWQIAVLMMGNAELVSRFRSMYNIPFPIYIDQSLQVYDYFDIGEGSWFEVLSPQVLIRQARLLVGGMELLNGSGSMRRLGGTVAINRAGEVVYHHVANPIYRYPEWSSVLQALPKAS